MADVATDHHKQAELANAFYSKGRKLWAKGEKDEALGMFRKAVAMQESVLGTYHKNTARTYYWVGFALRHKHEYDKALVAYRRTLRIRMSLFGEHDISTEDVHRALRDVLKEIKFSDEEIEKYFRCLTNSVDHEKNGNNFMKSGKFDDAIHEFENCLGIEDTAVGRFPLDSAEIQVRISNACKEKGEFDKAINYYRQALIIYDDKLGRDHPKTMECIAGIKASCSGKGLDKNIQEDYCIEVFRSITLVNKADKIVDEGAPEKAISLYENAIELEEELLGRDHLIVGDIHQKIAAAFTADEKYDQAILATRRALYIFAFEYDIQHPKVASALKEIAMLCTMKAIEENVVNRYLNTVTFSVKYERYGETMNKEGDFQRAMDEFQKSLALEASALGKYHLTQAGLFRGIGNSYIGLEKFDHALVNYRNALLIQFPNLGILHADTQKTIRRIVYALEDKGVNSDEVDEYRLNVVRSVEAEVTGDMFLRGGDHEKAVASYRKAVSIEESTLGHFHLCTADLYRKIATTLEILGDNDKAIAAFRDVLALHQLRLGMDHPNSEKALADLEAIAMKKGLTDQDANDYGGKATVSISLEDDADMYVKATSLDEAIGTYERAIEIEESSLGENHLTTAAMLTKIGDVHRIKEQNVQAILVYRKAMGIHVSHGNSDGAAKTLFSLGLAVENLGFTSATALRYQRVIWDSIEHEKQGDRLRARGEILIALSEYRRAISLEESVLGKLCATTIDICQKMADICEEKKDHESAILFLTKVLAMQESYLGGKSPDTLRTYNSLVVLAEKHGTANGAGLQGWSTLEYVLMCLIGLLITIMAIVKTRAKKEAPIKELKIAAYNTTEAPPLPKKRVETKPILRGRSTAGLRSSGGDMLPTEPPSDDSYVMVGEIIETSPDADTCPVNSPKSPTSPVTSTKTTHLSFASAPQQVNDSATPTELRSTDNCKLIPDVHFQFSFQEAMTTAGPLLEGKSAIEGNVAVAAIEKSTLNEFESEKVSSNQPGTDKGDVNKSGLEVLVAEKTSMDQLNTGEGPTPIVLTGQPDTRSTAPRDEPPKQQKRLSALAQKYLALAESNKARQEGLRGVSKSSTQVGSPPPMITLSTERSVFPSGGRVVNDDETNVSTTFNDITEPVASTTNETSNRQDEVECVEQVEVAEEVEYPASEHEARALDNQELANGDSSSDLN